MHRFSKVILINIIDVLDLNFEACSQNLDGFPVKWIPILARSLIFFKLIDLFYKNKSSTYVCKKKQSCTESLENTLVYTYTRSFFWPFFILPVGKHDEFIA